VIYRDLGHTGYRVSQLGFGAMRLPTIGEGENARVDREQAIPMIHRAFEAGVNYIDTAVGYCNQDSQRTVGEALQGWRDKIVLSTKNPEYDDESTWWQNLENSLQRLQTDHIDIYNHHGMNLETWTTKAEPQVSKWMRKARDQGLVKHICYSFHDSNENLEKLIATGYPEVITLQYNMLDQSLAQGIALAHERGIGIVVMGPVAGGRLGASSPVLEQMVPGITRVPELALRFVLANPAVSLALSGMSSMQQVEENVATAAREDTLSQADVDAIEQHLQRLKGLADLYCTGCNYCQPCEQEVNIPYIFKKYNEGRVYGLWQPASQAYTAWRWVEGKNAEACIECGDCEPKCPQHLAIRDELKAAHEALTRAR
jgi:predicted aldo/keto reductase-like oxidoreductase